MQALAWWAAHSKEWFLRVQLGLVIASALALIVWLRSGTSATRFKRYGSDEPARGPGAKGSRSAAAHAKPAPRALPGFRLDGEPHEILGVPKNASAAQVKRAYRDLMKRYHPDVVAPAGSRAWREAQKVAEAINRAKAQLLGE